MEQCIRNRTFGKCCKYQGVIRVLWLLYYYAKGPIYYYIYTSLLQQVHFYATQ